MKTILWIGCLLRCVVLGFEVQAQEPYNSNETAKLRQFLLQESAEPGVKNYQQLGVESMDGINWGLVAGLSWSNNNTRSLNGVDWQNKKLSGNMDFSDFQTLQALYCSSNMINSVNVTGAVLLRAIDFYGNNLEALDVTTNNKLTFLRVTHNNIKEIDLSNNPELTFICCTNNSVKSLDFSNNKKIETIYCINNELSYINVRNCPRLEELLCPANNLTEIDISNKEFLFDFACARNNLSSLNVVNCPVLPSIDCSDNELEVLDLAGCTALHTVKCYNNRLKELYIEDCLLLETLVCNNNLLDSLKLPESSSLSVLNCKDNNLDFCTLPPILPDYTEYIYSPQHNRTTEAVIDSADFSRYYELDGIISRYTWNKGLTWIKPEMRENGIFVFDESYAEIDLICRIENNTFPKMVLRYDVTMKRRDVSNPVTEEPSTGSVYAGKGFVHVVTASPADVGIYSTGGKCVYYNNVREGRTDIPLNPGIYVVSVSGRHGKAVHVK
ncbi:MAG: hypothetical protein LBC19_05985 [Tannerella sp.]|jgi:hypothetical protein|nr:hypothetical protein [Tannerella sp.]